MPFGGALVSSVCNVFAPRYLQRYGAPSATAFGMAAGAAAFAALLAAAGAPEGLAAATPGFWWALAYLVVIGSAGNFVLWLWALERIAPTRVAIAVTLNPLAAAAPGAWLLGEEAGPLLVAGLALVGLSIWLVNRPADGRGG